VLLQLEQVQLVQVGRQEQRELEPQVPWQQGQELEPRVPLQLGQVQLVQVGQLELQLSLQQGQVQVEQLEQQGVRREERSTGCWQRLGTHPERECRCTGPHSCRCQLRPGW
jgi:hypothetical protein